MVGTAACLLVDAAGVFPAAVVHAVTAAAAIVPPR